MTGISATMRPPTFGTAVRGELTLARRRPAVWVSLGIWAFCLAFFAYTVSHLTTAGAAWYTTEQQELLLSGLLPAALAHYPLASLPLYAAPQFAVLGAILGAAGHARGTLRIVISRFARRAPYSGGRLVCLVMIGFAAAVVTMLASGVSSVIIALATARSTALPPIAELALAFLAIWLVAVTFLAIGFALGELTRSVLAGVAIAAAWTLGVESLTLGLLAPVVPVLEVVQGMLPVGATASLAASFVPADLASVSMLHGTTSPGIAVLVLAGWTILAMAAAAVSLDRRDLT